MSALASDTLPTTVAGELTTTLIPTVTRIDTQLDVSPVSVFLAVSIVCILSPITVTGNSIILAAFYRYKRLRTASNCLLVSLAISDFGTCMLVDIFCGTNILSDWAVVWLGLPILAHSGANPWIYAFHHGEMRVAAGKIAGDLIALVCLMPSRYGCSPTRRGTNTNLELAEINNSNESRRHPVEDCFAAKHHGVLYSSRRCLEVSGRHTNISPEKNDIELAASSSSRHGDIVEENIHDLTKMLDPKYIIDRSHVIDTNHNIDKIKNLKYLLDPTFSKIRHLRRLNRKRISHKNFPLISEPKFTSYQNLKSADGAHSSRKYLQLNALSDPMLNTDSPVMDAKDFNEVLCRNNDACNKWNAHLSSMSDSNIKAATRRASQISSKLFPVSGNDAESYGYSVQNLDLNHSRYEGALARHTMMLCQQIEDQRRAKISPHPRRRFRRYFGRASPNLNLRLRGDPTPSSSAPDSVKPSYANSPRRSASPGQLTITPNKLANLINLDPPSSRSAHSRVDLTARALTQARRNLDILNRSESINTIDPMTRVTLLEPSNLMDSLIVPTIHSEPPSPIDPLPSAPLQGEEAQSLEISMPIVDVTQRNKSPLSKRSSPVRYSDPVIPTVLLNIEDFSEPSVNDRHDDCRNGSGNDLLSGTTPTLEPIDLFEALLRNSDKCKDARLPEPIFAEHDSTRFSSRRPSDSKWSESSRSQEVLSSVTEHQTTFPSSYSVNNFQTCCNSGSDLNDLTSLDPFMCPDALTSSLRESFFSAPSVPDSDIFTSFEESDDPGLTPEFTPDSERDAPPYNSVSTINLKRCVIEAAMQSRSTESVHRVRHPSTRSCAILRLEPSVHSSRLRVRPCTSYILKDPPAKRNPRLAPLAIPTPTDICTPTFDVVSTEIKGDKGVGVRV
ncbi:Melanopsin-B [Harpegnathos saltator]|uniref:Melanopsin-B n=1 Tax=Harpegnathos saltator TaxID=610380 RepID=E2BHQ6_HARSA|nr:Melanopsin-B [Harpegnathos saltator]